MSKMIECSKIKLPSLEVHVNVSFPAPGTMKSVALYWSAWACLPIIIGFSHPVTSLGMFLHMMGSLNTVPPSTFLIVPLGLFHIFFSLNSSTRFSSGVIVAHLIPTLYFFTASAQSRVTLSSVKSRFSMPKSYT